MIDRFWKAVLPVLVLLLALAAVPAEAQGRGRGNGGEERERAESAERERRPELRRRARQEDREEAPASRVRAPAGSYGAAHDEFHDVHDRQCQMRGAERPLDPMWQLRVRAECKQTHDQWHRQAGRPHE